MGVNSKRGVQSKSIRMMASSTRMLWRCAHRGGFSWSLVWRRSRLKINLSKHFIPTDVSAMGLKSFSQEGWDLCGIGAHNGVFLSCRNVAKGQGSVEETDEDTLRTPLSGTCLLKEVCRKPLFGVWDEDSGKLLAARLWIKEALLQRSMSAGCQNYTQLKQTMPKLHTAKADYAKITHN